MKIKLLNKIAKVGVEVFDPDLYTVGAEVDTPDGILVRSASMLDMDFPKNLRAVARAGAGVNNIPLDRCAEHGVVVFNTPGANANAVKELTVCALMLASRKIVQGIQWVSTLTDNEMGTVEKFVEKGKSAYAGHEIYGETLGVVGLGAIGRLVANAAVDLGMKVIGCDPYLSVDGAWQLSREVHHAPNYEAIYRDADVITLHVPTTPITKGMINTASLSQMKDGVRIINLARGDLVNVDDLKAALAKGKVSAYVTDFPTAALQGIPGVIAIPHLGASTEESEENCAKMAAMELDDYLRHGNIRNSVNFPSISAPYCGDVRLCLLHKNIPGIIAKISAKLSDLGINIEKMLNDSKGNYAYTIVEINGSLPVGTDTELSEVEGMLLVRVIEA